MKYCFVDPDNFEPIREHGKIITVDSLHMADSHCVLYNRYNLPTYIVAKMMIVDSVGNYVLSNVYHGHPEFEVTRKGIEK